MENKKMQKLLDEKKTIEQRMKRRASLQQADEVRRKDVIAKITELEDEEYAATMRTLGVPVDKLAEFIESIKKSGRLPVEAAAETEEHLESND